LFFKVKPIAFLPPLDEQRREKALFGVRINKQNATAELFFWLIDPSGNLLSEQKFTGTQGLQAEALPSGGYALVVQSGTSDQDRAVLRLDSSGKTLWSQLVPEFSGLNTHRILPNSADEGFSV